MEKNNDHNNPESGKLLNSFPKKELIQAPEGYFEQFPAALANRLKEAPVFYSIEKKETVTVPAGYAQALEAKIMQAIQTKKPVKIVPLYTQVLHWTAVAAGLALLFTIGYVFLGSNKNQPTPEGMVATYNVNSNADYNEYLAAEINMDELVAFYVAEQQVSDTSSENSAVVDYLMGEEGLELENY